MIYELLNECGYTVKQFSKDFKIPYNTVRQWYAGIRECPDYLLSLLSEKVRQKKLNECKKTLYLLVLDGEISYTYDNIEECEKWFHFCKNVTRYKSVEIREGFYYVYV